VLNPRGIITWLVVGLIAGWLAGLFMQRGGSGVIGDIIVGLIGGFLGGLVFSLLVESDAGLWASVAVAFVGDCILISLLGAVVRRRRLGRFSNGRLDDHRWKAR
jgi:uncharacterized membrane protein YeaQ/YmgE (transglycosylase-associated protein family)